MNSAGGLDEFLRAGSVLSASERVEWQWFIPPVRSVDLLTAMRDAGSRAKVLAHGAFLSHRESFTDLGRSDQRRAQRPCRGSAA
jgi:hypothetical protein